jgi:hypothetical protein
MRNEFTHGYRSGTWILTRKWLRNRSRKDVRPCLAVATGGHVWPGRTARSLAGEDDLQARDSSSLSWGRRGAVAAEACVEKVAAALVEEKLAAALVEGGAGWIWRL